MRLTPCQLQTTNIEIKHDGDVAVCLGEAAERQWELGANKYGNRKMYEVYLAKFSLTTDLINQEDSLEELLERMRGSLVSPGDPIQLKTRGKTFWWAFEYLYPLQSEFGSILVCCLLKISDDEITRFDWGNRKSFTESFKDHVLDSSLYAVNVKEELVLFQKRPGISINQFCYEFANLVNATAELHNTLLSPVKNRGTRRTVVLYASKQNICIMSNIQYRPGPLESAVIDFYRRNRVRSPQDIDL